ncbi:MAG: adenylate/guanylate cyclase domain-containing protein [Polyangiaceae bacterium]
MVKTVRAKLVALVIACMAPAVVGAVLRAREAETTLLDQATRRVDRVNSTFAAEIQEQEANAKLALTFAHDATKFQQALAAHDSAGAQRLVGMLADVYKYRIVLAADAQGDLVAVGNPKRAPKSLRPDASPPFAELLAGKPLRGMIPLKFADGDGYAFVAGDPVVIDGKQVGALVLINPIEEAYLDHLKKKVDADLSLRVNGKRIGSSTGHPSPDLESHAVEAVFQEEGGKLYALKTFKPEALQRPGQVVELTASRDATELRQRSRDLLVHSAALLVPVLFVGLAIALFLARRIGDGVRAISGAAAEVKDGKYVMVPEPAQRDELGLLALDFNAMVKGLIERDRLRETFGRYVTRQVADHLLAGKVELGGELIPVTVLFSDIRSFTTISERMPPRELLDFLNVYFSAMVESVMKHDGVVDKFIGDAIMAVFGAPVPRPGDALNAVKAALEMRARLAKMNEGFRARGLPEIRAGIGLHTGEVVAGNMGHVERMEYTVIGDAVNLASRLEGMTKELACDVLLSEDLYKEVAGSVDAEPLKRVHVKGREQEVMVYRLKGLREVAAGAA